MWELRDAVKLGIFNLNSSKVYMGPPLPVPKQLCVLAHLGSTRAASSFHNVSKTVIFHQISGPMDIYGVECPVFCGCKPDEMMCEQGIDEFGCQREPICMPMKGGNY